MNPMSTKDSASALASPQASHCREVALKLYPSEQAPHMGPLEPFAHVKSAWHSGLEKLASNKHAWLELASTRPSRFEMTRIRGLELLRVFVLPCGEPTVRNRELRSSDKANETSSNVPLAAGSVE
eukprot:CAMPEP_0171693084 /NCGR_PEP_ID=MMETSP0991-20121206/6438_1 /TAXON_ID=483369 /ORGANISM="non described non described, Strain CCMP2098" /LENGTH=124 /DNA_ID=CAMNT_0012281465 /DNA_START=83 /DNA_END=457 /DNA_ORIENTATION=+